MSTSPTSPTGLGNTDNQPQQEETKNKKAVHGSRSKNWCFTFNNYDLQQIPNILEWLEQNAEKWCFQEETGENGTPHLQGVICFKNSKTLLALKRCINNTVHWEKCKNFQASVNYCQKEESRTGKIYSKGIKIIKTIKDPLKIARPWQEKILNIIKNEPDDRTIYWIYDKIGKTGKSALSKHILLKNQDTALEVSGKSHDIKHGIVQFLENNNLEILLLDVPRTSEKFISYEAIESVKNGKFFSGKYEGKMVLFNPPHIIVFSNFLPEITKLSIDRWKIYEIIEMELNEIDPENLLNKDKIN